MGGYANGGDAENSTSTDPQTRLGGDGGPYVLTTTEITTIVVTITVFLLVLFLIFYFRKLQARRKLDMMTKAAAALEDGTRSRKNSATPLGSSAGIELKLKDIHKDKDGAGSTATSVSSSATTIGTAAPGPRPNTPAPPAIPAKDKARGGEDSGKERVQDGSDPFTTPGSSTHNVAAAAAAAAARISHPPSAVIATRMTTSGVGEKPPLWKYIHWKGDPKRSSKNGSLLPQVEPRRRGSGGVVQDKDEAPIPPNPYYG